MDEVEGATGWGEQERRAEMHWCSEWMGHHGSERGGSPHRTMKQRNDVRSQGFGAKGDISCHT